MDSGGRDWVLEMQQYMMCVSEQELSIHTHSPLMTCELVQTDKDAGDIIAALSSNNVSLLTSRQMSSFILAMRAMAKVKIKSILEAASHFQIPFTGELDIFWKVQLSDSQPKFRQFVSHLHIITHSLMCAILKYSVCGAIFIPMGFEYRWRHLTEG